MSTISATANSDCPTPVVTNVTLPTSPSNRCLTHCLYQNDIITGAFAQHNRLIRVPRDAPQRSATRRRTDVSVGIHRESRHPRFVAHERAAGAARARVDGQHGDFVALRGEEIAEALDESALAGARRSGEA